MKKVLLVLLLATGAFGQANFTIVNVLGRSVAVWKPDQPTSEHGYPLILFSHGFTGCNNQSVFLMEALAHAGYVVVAPNHRDATCGTARAKASAAATLALLHPQQPFHDPAKWSDTTYRDRWQDMEAVLHEALLPHSFIGVPIDAENIGVVGHSLGGYTALGLAGAWPAWKDAHIKAVLALSPHCSPFLDHGNLTHLNVPVMYQGGTRDLGETSLISRKDGAYDVTSAPKYYVEFNGAGHFAWTNAKKNYQPIISQYSVAFFDRYLKGVNNSQALQSLITKFDSNLISDARASDK
jgi:predicted dienelactone hydrolase